VTGGKLPKGVTLFDVENVYLRAVKSELERVFAQWGISSLSIRLTVAKGNITAIKVLKSWGGTCRMDILEKILGTIHLNSTFSGEITLDLNYR